MFLTLRREDRGWGREIFVQWGRKRTLFNSALWLMYCGLILLLCKSYLQSSHQYYFLCRQSVLKACISVCVVWCVGMVWRKGGLRADKGPRTLSCIYTSHLQSLLLAPHLQTQSELWTKINVCDEYLYFIIASGLEICVCPNQTTGRRVVSEWFCFSHCYKS